MRWTIEKNPELGDKRTVIKFAWFPVEVKGDIAVWLEKYEERQEYKRITSYDFDCGCTDFVDDWVPIERSAIVSPFPWKN